MRFPFKWYKIQKQALLWLTKYSTKNQKFCSCWKCYLQAVFASLLSSEPNELDFDNEDHPIESSINFDLFIE